MRDAVWSKMWRDIDIQAEMDTIKYDGHLEIIDRLLGDLQTDAFALESGCGLGRRVIHATFWVTK
jgi:hypothetical protein